jgi:D-amino-acid dehydrogenase
VSFGYCRPWAAPGIPLKAVKWLFHAPCAADPAPPDAAMMSWMARMLMNCTSDAYAMNKSRMLRLADYSRDCADRTAHGYRHRSMTSACKARCSCSAPRQQLEASAKDVKALKPTASPARCWTRRLHRAEPALAHARDKIVGGLLTPLDETGDCFKFTNALAEMAVATRA